MKFTKIHLLGFAILSSLALVSCDSSTPVSELDSATNLSGTAKSELTLLQDDEFIYTAITANDEIAPVLTMGSPTEASAFGTPTYQYVKTGDFTFELRAVYTTQENLTNALALALRDPSPLGTRLREILFRRQAIFTAGEVQEIIDILNPAGADLTTDPTDPTRFSTASRREILHEVTSTNGDLLAGVQSGIYQIREAGFEVTFREATAADLASFRLLSPLHKIPQATNTSFTPRVIEEGRWQLTLKNN